MSEWNAYGLSDSEMTRIFDNFCKTYDGPEEDSKANLNYEYALATQRHYQKMEAGARIVYSMMRSQKRIPRSEVRLASLCLRHAIRVRGYEASRELRQDCLWALEYVRHMRNFTQVVQRSGFALALPFGTVPGPLDPIVYLLK